MTTNQGNRLQELLHQHLRPLVKDIDEQGKYPGDLVKLLGQAGYFSVGPAENLKLIRDVATVCGSTAFVVWCQAAAISFVYHGNSELLKRELLPALLSGEVAGGTGISNAMKFYAGMENLRLNGERTSSGYRIEGTLPFVSNLGPDAWFGVLFQNGETQRGMAMAASGLVGLTRKEVDGFLGLNGTATFSCQFQHVEIPESYILTDNADELIAKIRPSFLLTQTGVALGVTQASLNSMFALQAKQKGANSFLNHQPEGLQSRLERLTERVERLAEHPMATKEYFKEVVKARLDGAYLALDAAQSEMMHAGAAGYVAGSSTSRRLRESLFLTVVTPAVKQLEKMLQKL
ncbi:hypothetical protein CIG75_14275 [Tumebacillus algifaecis]|uniref:Acyl-CoA dehydrogenase/oxidase N-terminal domain-containing protein n=1 Tax=Tumebacillus algifaecis TaxID=1214604 RepID=A0A223D3S2_9BACL|nr:acyl-CoA dehydrogenase family protein [Tumebacillus algifaecis]ASS76014.1 hypothetical protein CIG75_14275 [Tumebacillus algifaecis]